MNNDKMGFAGMNPAMKRVIQRQGVLASMKSPRRRKFTREEAQAAAMKMWARRRATSGAVT